MPFLIDGYNLLYALGMAGRQTEPQAFERARRELLDRLSAAHGEAAREVRVVFDAVNVAGDGDNDEEHGGLRVRYTRGRPADDAIEELIRQEPVPKRLVVVSSDRRIQTAARRRSCEVWDCPAYIDWLLAQGNPRPPSPGPPPPGKPEGASPEEVEELLREFGEG